MLAERGTSGRSLLAYVYLRALAAAGFQEIKPEIALALGEHRAMRLRASVGLTQPA